jgi:Cu/Ag efflux protein CusF
MKTKYLLIVLAVFGVSACQSNQTARGKNANQTHVVTNVSKVDKQIAEMRKSAAGSNVVQAKYYPGTGVLTQINKKTGEVEINHGEIKDKKPAAKTKFIVKYDELMQDLKIGDKVNFVLEDDAGTEMLSTIFKNKTTQN